jgi:hypothetical protein
MPIPAALAAAGAISSAIGAGQAISGSRRSKFDKRNEAELDELLGLQDRDQLGLTGSERSIAERSLLDPVRQASAETRRRAEAAIPGSGASGADLARLRTEQTGAIAGAGERAALALDQADQRKTAAQRQEIAQREAIAETRRQERQASLFGGVAQAAGAAGQVAGAVPEALRAAGLAGAPIADQSGLIDKLDELGVGPEGQAIIKRMNPRKLTRALADAEQYLATGDKQFLTEDSVDIIRAAQAAQAAQNDPLAGLSDEDVNQLIQFGGA